MWHKELREKENYYNIQMLSRCLWVQRFGFDETVQHDFIHRALTTQVEIDWNKEPNHAIGFVHSINAHDPFVIMKNHGCAVQL